MTPGRNRPQLNARLLRFSDLDRTDMIPEGKLFRFSFDANLNMMRVVCRDRHAFDCMRDAFSDVNQTAFYMSMHGFESSEKVYLINAFGYFRPGLFFDVASYIQVNYGGLSEAYMSEQCRDYVSEYLVPLKRYVRRFDRSTFKIANIRDDRGLNARLPEESRLNLRDYQSESIRSIIFDGFGRGLVELPTSAGKSFVIANLIHNIDSQILKGLRYLIFVPNTQLVQQFHKDLLDYGFRKDEVTQLAAGGRRNPFNPDAQIVITNRQYVFKNRDLLPKIDVLINDEVHQGKPKSATIDFVDSLDCAMKIGFSGTIPRGKYERLSLVGSFGRVLFREEITQLQKQGFISKLEINLIKIRDMDVERNRELPFNEYTLRRFDISNPDSQAYNEAYNAEIEYINSNYGKLYAPIIEKLTSLEGNTLVLFDRLEFGRNMFELAKEFAAGRSVFYVDGQTPVADRESMRRGMEESSSNIVFGQCSILSTGINIKNLTNLVMMVSTKSFSRVLQSIGRTLRLHKDKDTARLFDISFNFKYSQKHLQERLKIYRTMYKKRPDTQTLLEV